MCTADCQLKDQKQLFFHLWTINGPSVYQLQETVLESDKTWCTYVVVNYVGLQTF